MTIEVQLSGTEFRRFTIFDLLRRRKQWRGPVLFALILGVSAALCFTRTETQGAMLLGNVLLSVGLGLPCVYFAYFFSSLNRQVRKQGLTRPQHVYTVTLEEKSKGILADNGKEQLTYAWKSVHHAYRNLTATYLYLTPQRALLLPHSCLEDPDALWALLTKKLPKEKCTVL
ncbi:MAG: YcxB family protein [Candidatus Faecousia sp.]|nr:YcxB family protein [Candidatus Faecousia sp.]